MAASFVASGDQVAQAAHRCLWQGSQDMLELHGILCDAFEDELPLHHTKPGLCI
jgi:hypothetical protein